MRTFTAQEKRMTMAAVRNSVWPEQSGVKEKPMDNNNSIKEEELVARIQELVSSLRADSRPEELDRIPTCSGPS